MVLSASWSPAWSRSINAGPWLLEVRLRLEVLDLLHDDSHLPVADPVFLVSVV